MIERYSFSPTIHNDENVPSIFWPSDFLLCSVLCSSLLSFEDSAGPYQIVSVYNLVRLQFFQGLWFYSDHSNQDCQVLKRLLILFSSFFFFLFFEWQGNKQNWLYKKSSTNRQLCSARTYCIRFIETYSNNPGKRVFPVFMIHFHFRYLDSLYNCHSWCESSK